MFGEAAVFDPDYVRSDPGDGPAVASEAAVDNDVVAFREDELMLVTQGVGRAPDQIEQTVAARFDVCAVLDVGVRPEAAGRIVVALVEQGIEGFEDESLVLFGVVLAVFIFLFELWVDGVRPASQRRASQCDCAGPA